MIGRELIFSNAEIIRLAREQFIPVTADDWYQRRREDAEGEFFRRVADQGPRKGKGGSTRQGIYVFTASGQLLGYRNPGDADNMRQELQRALARWQRLPARERQPGGVELKAAGPVDRRYERTPPKGTVVVDVFTRILDRTADGSYRAGSCTFPGGDQAARDHLWLLPEEWQKLLPANPEQGQQVPLPKSLVQRLVRFHLVDNTRGEPPMWRKDEVRKADLQLTVEKVDKEGVLLRLEGTAVLATSADMDQARRGYDVRLRGYLHFDGAKKTLDRFDVVAVGDHWGAGPFTPNPRPGKASLGVLFRLSQGDSPADQVPPQAAREIGAYLRPDR